ncbi:MAG TPA: heparan-alpha-glucosaminide N-acetyltransferase [Candidatus Bilamarchaeum sp.]|nr:heparan-alpha-glucosaminide N-acetyltransferase [Candidatus Bilamarchaeum sp.]
MARAGFVDAARGLAIVSMVIYHILFDLGYFGFAQIDLQFLPVLLFQRAIGSTFLIVAGISMWLSETAHHSYERHFQRFLRLAPVAIAITLATWIFPHEGFITFGIIHLMALSALIGPLFFRLGKWNALLGLALVIAGSLPPGLGSSSPYLFWLGLPSPAYTALDYYPLIPWFGMILIGVYLGQSVKWDKIKVSLPFQDALETAGKNSLAIYVIHQPVIIAVLLALSAVI